MTRHAPSPADIRAALVTTQEAGDILGIGYPASLELLYRRRLEPVLDHSRVKYWLKQDILDLAAQPRHHAGPPRKRDRPDPITSSSEET